MLMKYRLIIGVLFFVPTKGPKLLIKSYIFEDLCQCKDLSEGKYSSILPILVPVIRRIRDT